jgi:ankyrin repeat protein
VEQAGLSALHLAASGGHGACARALLQAGADASAGNAITGDTPLHAAASCMSGGGEDAVRALLQAGGNAAALNHFGKTPRDKAASDAVRALLSGGAGAAGAAALGALRCSWLCA